MNLINDPWIPVIHADGQRGKIAPWQLTDTENPVVELAAPRPDFQGALYQFLIGLLQTTFAPEDEDEWLAYLQAPPSTEQLKEVLTPFSGVFELFNQNGVAFMQELGEIDSKKTDAISQLLVGEPGINTIEKNQDLFIHAGNKNGFCESCCATSLYALSLNGPPGGAGHMAGLIGNGPVITLIKIDSSSLWGNLWVNVLDSQDMCSPISTPDELVFPWLSATKLSESCTSKGCPNGCNQCSTFPEDKSPLHAFWGMARRIRLQAPQTSGVCSLCGTNALEIYDRYATKPNGYRYMGGWVYSLSPRKYIDNEKPLEMLRGNQVSESYADWLGLVYSDDSTGIRSSLSVNSFLNKKIRLLGDLVVGMHCYYYDMQPGQAKARCWYDHRLPLVFVGEEYQGLFYKLVSDLLNTARDVVKELRSQIKSGWFNRPKDVKGDTSMIDQSFWQATEPAFYQQIKILSELPSNIRTMPASVAASWRKLMFNQALALFDYWVLEGDAEDMDMKRITSARRFLLINLGKLKSLQHLEQLAATTGEVA